MSVKIAFLSIGDPRDVRVWSGIPHFVLKELHRQVDSVEIVAPLSRWFKYLYAPAKTVHAIRHTGMQLDRHPLALSSYSRQIMRSVAGKGVDAIVSMSSVPIARLDTDIPIFFWTDAVVEGMAGYYPGSFTGMSPAELKTCHLQEQNAMDRSAYAAYSSDWAVRIVRDNYEISSEKIGVLEFGANLDVAHDQSHIEALVTARINSSIKLLFIGVDWQRKGGAIAAEAAKLLNDRGIPAVLQVVGCPVPDLPFVEGIGFIDKSTLAGQQQLKQLLEEASFFLFPTRSEAAGIVFAEASAYGLPIVSTNTGGVTNYVIEGQNGVCLSLEAEASDYADSIEHILNDASLYHQLSVGGFRLYESRLNWQSSVTKLLGHLKSAH